MSIKHFESQEELDSEFERIEEINMERLSLKEEVSDAEYRVAEAKDELEIARDNLKSSEQNLMDFEEENREILV